MVDGVKVCNFSPRTISLARYMHELTFHFHTGNKLLSRAIRFFSRGNFNHTSIQIGDTIWESHIHTGVHKKKRIDWNGKTIKESITILITEKQKRKVVAWLNRQVGKKYDWLGALSVIWRCFKQKIGSWYCSELGMVAWMKAKDVPSSKYNQRKSPQDLFELLTLIQCLK